MKANRKQQLNHLTALASAGVIFLLSGLIPAETADYHIRVAQLPAEVIQDCQDHNGNTQSTCLQEQAFNRVALAVTNDSELFLVNNNSCKQGHSCKSWLVEKSGSQIQVKMSFTGQFWLRRQGHQYPIIDTLSAADNGQSLLQSYAWQGDAYHKTTSDIVYSIEGDICGTGIECKQLAKQALENNDNNEVVKIWRSAFGVAWI